MRQGRGLLENFYQRTSQRWRSVSQTSTKKSPVIFKTPAKMIKLLLGKKLGSILLILILYSIYVIFSTNSPVEMYYYYIKSPNGIYCYHIKENSLPNINDNDIRKGETIFFHETSCRSHDNGKIVILPRQACAIESAARMNPNYDVKVLFTSTGVLKFDETESDRILKALLTYPNVEFLHLDFENYTKNTLLEKLYTEGVIDASKYAQSHASDILRYLTLWKYGGIYLDLDVIVLKSLEDLPPNYSGSESDINVAAGVMSFSPTGVGHSLARACLEDLKLHFNGNNWGNNGPGVITRLLRSLCGVKNAKDMLNKPCGGFKVHPIDAFYPVAWWNWTMYFDPKLTNTVFQLANNSYVIHVWNKHSVKSKIPINSTVPYVSFAKKYCPKILAECEEYF